MQYQRNQGALRRCRSALDAVSDDQPVTPVDLTLDAVIVVMIWPRTCFPGPPLVASKGGPPLPPDGGEWVGGPSSGEPSPNQIRKIKELVGGEKANPVYFFIDNAPPMSGFCGQPKFKSIESHSLHQKKRLKCSIR